MYPSQGTTAYCMDQQCSDELRERWDARAVEAGVLSNEVLTAEATKSEQAWWLITAASCYRGQLRWW